MKPVERPTAATADAISEFATVRDWIRHACSRFAAAGISFGHGTDNAWDEAAWLVLWALRLPLDSLDPVLDARLTREERAFVFGLVERRCNERIPTAYLTGEAWLRGRRFVSDSRALVPRSLIAEALEESLDDWLSASGPASVLDLCTGGGSLAILAAQRFPASRVDATDISADALALARENLALHGMDDGRVSLRQGDLFEALAGERYDLILCNPPYVNETSMSALPAEYQAEPRTALAGGADGMDVVRRILAQAAAHLNRRGLLLLEIGHEAAHFESAFPDLEFTYVPVSAGENELVLVTRSQLTRTPEH